MAVTRAATPVKFTYAEYRTLPETGPRYQVVDGELLMSPAPTTRHQRIVLRLAARLLEHAEARGLGIVLPAPADVILSATDIVQPDILFVTAARAGLVRREGVFGGPDLVVEVLSPSTRDLDLGATRVLYAWHGTRELWAVDPDANTVDVYRLAEDPASPRERLAEHGILRTALLPGLDIVLAGVFAA